MNVGPLYVSHGRIVSQGKTKPVMHDRLGCGTRSEFSGSVSRHEVRPHQLWLWVTTTARLRGTVRNHNFCCLSISKHADTYKADQQWWDSWGPYATRSRLATPSLTVSVETSQPIKWLSNLPTSGPVHLCFFTCSVSFNWPRLHALSQPTFLRVAHFAKLDCQSALPTYLFRFSACASHVISDSELSVFLPSFASIWTGRSPCPLRTRTVSALIEPGHGWNWLFWFWLQCVFFVLLQPSSAVSRNLFAEDMETAIWMWIKRVNNTRLSWRRCAKWEWMFGNWNLMNRYAFYFRLVTNLVIFNQNEILIQHLIFVSQQNKL